MTTDMTYSIAAFYRFVSISNVAEFHATIKERGQSLGIVGVFLIAEEGINATIAGQKENLTCFLEEIQQDTRLENLEIKYATTTTQPFTKWRVRKKKEIVSMGVESVQPTKSVGTYVPPKDWNQLIEQDDVIVVDVRNDYEYLLGTFEGALNPKTDTFREFPEFVQKHLLQHKNKKIAMFCTGGIRCEKATSFLVQEGFEQNQVFHLQGGILKYMEDVPSELSAYEGECFLFDRRRSVVHGEQVGELQDGVASICYACSYPLMPEDLQSQHYESGVSCHRCYQSFTDEQKNRFRERQAQYDRYKESHFCSLPQK